MGANLFGYGVTTLCQFTTVVGSVKRPLSLFLFISQYNMCYLPFNARINICGINKTRILSFMEWFFNPINNIIMKMGEPMKTKTHEFHTRKIQTREIQTREIQTREIQTQTQNQTQTHPKLQWNIIEIK